MGKKILIVDDEGSIVDLCQQWIGTLVSEWKVEGHVTLEEGTKYGLEHIDEISAILLDGNLKRFKGDNNPNQGWQIAKVMREAGYKGIILCLAGQPFKESVPEEARGFYDGFFHKPLDWDKVVDYLKAKGL